jgi:hypothetical protein
MDYFKIIPGYQENLLISWNLLLINIVWMR